MKIPRPRRALDGAFFRIAVGLCICGLAACASERDPDPGPARPPPPHGPQLFISLSGEPFRAGPDQPYPSAAWFARADANHDGRLDRAEVRADATAFFKVLDTNHDGVIDSFELGDYEQKVVPEILGAYLGDASPTGATQPGQPRGGGRRGHSGSRGGGLAPLAQAPSGGGYEGAAPFELTNEPEPVAAADLNVSGRISLDEFLQTVDRRFDEIDKAHAGALSFNDLPKTPIQQLAAGPKRGVSQGGAGRKTPGQEGPPPLR